VGFWDSFGEEQARSETFWSKVERRQPEITRLRNLTRQAVSSDQAAKKSYFELLKAGLKCPELLEMLVAHVVSVYGAQKGAKRGNQDWCSGTKMGMSVRTLSRFPRRVQSLADEIERLNLHPLLTPDFWFFNPRLGSLQGLKLTDSLKKSLALWFGRLPRLMRCYAAYVEWQSKTMSQRVRKRKRASVNRGGVVLDALMHFVRQETGRDRHTDLSNILQATANVAKVERAFDPDMLKMRALRNRKRLNHG
jgi:hypothetical protein